MSSNEYICLSKRCFGLLNEYLCCRSCGRQHLLIDGRLRLDREVKQKDRIVRERGVRR